MHTFLIRALMQFSAVASRGFASYNQNQFNYERAAASGSTADRYGRCKKIGKCAHIVAWLGLCDVNKARVGSLVASVVC